MLNPQNHPVFQCSCPKILVGTFLAISACFASRAELLAAEDPVPPPPAPMLLEANSQSAAERLLQAKPLSSLKASTKPPEGDLPQNFAIARMAEIGTLFDSIDDSRPWMISTECEWDAPASRHLPLIFEEPNLERLGYTQRYFWDAMGLETPPLAAELVQPAVSGAKFFGHALTVPYFLGADHPFEPIYTLGTDRPGSPVVYREHLIPLSLTGALLQAGVVMGIVAIP